MDFLPMDLRIIMPFILATDSIAKLDSLRAEYQKERKVDLSVQPSMIGMPAFFGGTNIEARSIQVTFLEKMKIILQSNLLKEEDIKTPEEWQANLTASRVMIAASLYVLSQIGSSKRNSALYRIIEDSLGITTNNAMDENDKEICYLAANRLINSSKIALDEGNSALKKAGCKPISEKEWSDFSKFLHSSCNVVKRDNPYTNYPITSITQPLFGAAFSYTGATIGFLGGDVISHSTKAMSTRYQLTAFIGSTLIILGPAGPTGVAIFAPVIAGKLITAFCSISLAHVLGVVMGIVGQGVGLGVGLPLDLAYRLLWKACAVIGSHYYKETNAAGLSGVRIADGMIVISGIVIEVTPEDKLPEGYKQHHIEIGKDNQMYIDGKQVTTPDTGVQLPPDVIEELKAQLKAHSKELENESAQTTTSI